MVKNPVYGRKVNAERSRFFTEYRGKIYQFCCAHREGSFLKAPERYAKEEGREPVER
ncbi:MAG: YHS domain-containing protein [Armatimonadota bacterium]